ncbi:hypothetical protein [Rhodococcus sp. C3V]|uniref:hypothetical protein n=1 Tax=Rhodococcus sp. C3V TaxID=3034165 RepID=UPI000B053F19|nr:hypothetical protein [Rhodococcus sp. C3V]MDF3317296.1 hypothetical protein [Rhodococcus sp. C3V]
MRTPAQWWSAPNEHCTPGAGLTWRRNLTIDAVVVILIVVILGGMLRSVIVGPLFYAVFAVVAAIAFRFVLQMINA